MQTITVSNIKFSLELSRVHLGKQCPGGTSLIYAETNTLPSPSSPGFQVPIRWVEGICSSPLIAVSVH